jgi:S1-C subfamily serine protease
MNSTGSGVLIGPNQILTGAHVVANATFLQVQQLSDPNKVIASVKAICHDCDLALLTVEETSFSEHITPATVGTLPSLRDRVSVVGFPIGGEEISITEGVVSRVEIQRYSHSQRYLLSATVDAAINEGNSGGPVFQGDKVAGIAFQKMQKADNIGEMVPAPLIKSFLRGVEQGKSSNVPGLSLSTQTLENANQRKQVGLADDQTGVLVLSTEFGGSAWGVLQPGDVILRIDSLPIANNGTVLYEKRFRTRYDVVLSSYHVGDQMDVQVLRNGDILDLTMTLRPMQYLVPRSVYDHQPTYYICGGLVFQPLTQNFIGTWNRWRDAPVEFQYLYAYGQRTEEKQQVIVLTQVLCDAINVGYEDFYEQSVKRVNGTIPRDMKHFVEIIESSASHIQIEMSGGTVIVLDPSSLADAQQRILKHYHIPKERSDDLTP